MAVNFARRSCSGRMSAIEREAQGGAMILQSIVILVAMATGNALALDHPRLPHRVLHMISPAQLKAMCPGDFACAIADWGKRTCHVYVPNAHLPGWPSRRQLLAHEFRHCDGRGQD
jgi:hypothetical protein